jgi:hypothetical protein
LEIQLRNHQHRKATQSGGVLQRKSTAAEQGKWSAWLLPAILVAAPFPAAMLPTAAQAATISASTCSQADVQNAINGAADGDTVKVPAGSCSWGGLSINNKNITLQGAGTGCDLNLTPNGHPPSSCTGTSTNITSSSSGAIRIVNDTKPFRITGFRFNKDSYNGSHTITITKNNAYLSTKNSVPWRVDHVYFNGTSGHISINGARNFGLADHNLYYVPNGAQIFLFWGRGTNEQDGTSNLAQLSGQDAHRDPLALGSQDAFYIEDSEFFTNVWQGSQNVIDGTAGQRVVFRYNVSRGPMIENHGACSGRARGTFSWEIYENSVYPWNWTGSSGYQWAGIRLRGGTGVVFNNKFYGTWDSGAGEIYLDNQRTQSYVASDCGAPVNTYCNGSSAIDTNSVPGRNGPLCLDQLGAGSGAIGSQKAEPAYFWNNVNKGSGSSNSAINPRIASYNGSTPIATNRDVLNASRPGYTPLAYPHPLQNGGQPPVQGLAPPTGLTVR